MNPSDKYYIRLRLASSTGWLRIPMGEQLLFARIGDFGSVLVPTPPLPVSRPVNPILGQAHGCGLATYIDGERLLFASEVGDWSSRPLPTHMDVRAVSFDTELGLWAAGAVPSRRIAGASTEAAVRYQRSSSTDYESRSPRLGVVRAFQIISHGGLESLRGIDAEGDPLLATSDCAWFADDPSSFLFARRPRGRWTAARLAGRSLRSVLRLRPELALAVTAEGDLFLITAQGAVIRSGRHDALRAAIMEGIRTEVAPVRVVVRGADAQEDTIWLVAGLYAKREERLDWLITAAAESRDGGESWTVRAATRPAMGEPELVDVAIGALN